MTDRLRALSLSLLMVLSVVAGTAAFAGGAAAATNVSIAPDDAAAGASDVTYTAEGTVELANQDTLQFVDVHLGPADVSAVGADDVDVFVDGSEYTDGLTEFSASDGTVEFKLQNSRSVSDGDPIRVVVTDVANPADDFEANVTLHDTADDRWQTFADAVSIDGSANIVYSDLTLSETTVAPGEEVTVSATVENTGDGAGSYSAALRVNGAVRERNSGTLDGNAQTTTSFQTSFGEPGTYDVTIENLGTVAVTVTDSVGITGGSADPATVDPGTTVNNQQVFVDLSGVSQDGDTDTHYVEFPNALASGLSVNFVDANATSVTSSPNLVEGFDDDGVVDTVRFTTSGDGGGEINLRLTVDVSVDYPDTADTYSVDVRTEDSSRGVAQRSDVASIEAGTDGGGDAGSGGGASAGGGSGAGNGSAAAPTVRSFSVQPHPHGVVVSVVADSRLDDLRVDLGGATDVVLTRSSFTGAETDDGHAYTANVWLRSAGTVRGRLEVAAHEGQGGAAGQTDTAVLESPRQTAVAAVASPPWTGVESRHTFVVPVHEIENETLRNVTVAYGDRFTNASGSVTSVSDDQNVVTLTVVGPNGTVVSRMGGTDAVSVNVVDGEVRMDLSDVDDSRIPTLVPGARVVVELRPVTNPDAAGAYSTAVALGGANGTLDVTTTRIRVRNASPTSSFGAAYIPPGDGPVSVDLENASVVDRLSVDAGPAAHGILRVVAPDDRANTTAQAGGRVLATMHLSRPTPASDAAANVSVRLATDGVEADALALARYNASADRWHRLDTAVVEQSDGHVTVATTTQRTSTFAVVAAESADDGTTADGDDGAATGSSGGTATTGGGTAAGGPGFGVAAALVALVAAALLARRRRHRR